MIVVGGCCVWNLMVLLRWLLVVRCNWMVCKLCCVVRSSSVLFSRNSCVVCVNWLVRVMCCVIVCLIVSVCWFRLMVRLLVILVVLVVFVGRFLNCVCVWFSGGRSFRKRCVLVWLMFRCVLRSCVIVWLVCVLIWLIVRYGCWLLVWWLVRKCLLRVV